jgi:hypothetical protein
VRARTGLVTPAPDGPHVEQVGWGVARQVVRVLREAGVEDPAGILERLPESAERPGFLAYAVFEGLTASAAALVELPGDGEQAATYVGDAVTPEARPGTREALVVRALHDVASAGAAWLEVPEPRVDLRPLGFG